MFDHNKSRDENSNVIKYWRKHPKSIEKYQFVYHFLPREDKKKRADLLDNKAILIYCVLIVFVSVVFRFVPKFAPGVLGYASNITISDLLKYTNQKRKENGVPPLKLNAELSAAAEKKAQDMFKDGYWAHVAPDGTEPWDFILDEGYDYIYAGENLAKNFSNSKEVVEAWFKSPSHKSNLIGANYDEVGFAVVNGVMDGYETTLVVQMFGRPRQPSMLATVGDEKGLPGENKASAEGIEPASESLGESVSSPEQENSQETPSSEVGKEEYLAEGSYLVQSNANPAIDITTATKTVSLAFGIFVSVLLALDIIYSRKKGIRKFTGLTLAHFMVLVVVIISIWLVFKPGLVI
ncbi:MAG TPA: CAP domain-containing protein [bacterium]|nr:CAP domain-containing protein [bacterium]